MTKQELINWLISKGYTKDNYGHYQVTRNGEKIRVKIQATSARYEKQINLPTYDGKSEHEWLRIRSGYYKDLSINDKGQLSGMKV
jgi:hypothetical protein